MGLDRIKLHTTLDRLREITVAGENARRDLLAALIADIEEHLDKPISLRNTLLGLKRARREGFREGLIAMGLAWLLTACVTMVCGCFSDNGDGPDTGTLTGSTGTASATTSDATSDSASGEGSGTPSSTGAGTATTGASSGSTSTATGSTGQSGQTDSWTDGPYYGPCSDLGGCDPVIEECIHHYYGDVCGASCVTAADCPPPPPGQEVSCRDIDYTLPGEECMLVCTGDLEESTCPSPMHCVNFDNGAIKYCAYPK